jgi:late competence protein required for DNA uptake (superfamily II DNA/RNA helicase)
MERDIISSFLAHVMDRDAPKPVTNEPQACNKCGALTSNWKSEYPKTRKIYYQCAECTEKLRVQNQELLKNIDFSFMKNEDEKESKQTNK